LEKRLLQLSQCNDQASDLLKKNDLNKVLLIKPLTEIKEDICNVMETLDDPLSSTQVLDDTEELLDNMTDSMNEDEDDIEEVTFAAVENPLFSLESSSWKNPVTNLTESFEIPSIFVEDIDCDNETSEGEEDGGNKFVDGLRAELNELVYEVKDDYDSVKIKYEKIQVSASLCLACLFLIFVCSYVNTVTADKHVFFFQKTTVCKKPQIN